MSFDFIRSSLILPPTGLKSLYLLIPNTRFQFIDNWVFEIFIYKCVAGSSLLFTDKCRYDDRTTYKLSALQIPIAMYCKSFFIRCFCCFNFHSVFFFSFFCQLFHTIFILLYSQSLFTWLCIVIRKKNVQNNVHISRFIILSANKLCLYAVCRFLSIWVCLVFFFRFTAI